MEPVATPDRADRPVGTLHSQFTDWLDRRKPQEEKMLRAYQDNMRIARDDDTKDTGVSKAQKSKIFVGSTRGKVRTRARSSRMRSSATAVSRSTRSLEREAEAVRRHDGSDPRPTSSRKARRSRCSAPASTPFRSTAPGSSSARS
jgi:hypothetical protein